MGGVVGLCMVGVWLVWVYGVYGVWCGAGRAGNDWGVVYPITSFDKLLGEGVRACNRCGPQSASTNFGRR